MNSDTFPFPKNSISVPRNLCFFLDTVSSPQYSSIVTIILVFTSSSKWDTLLSSTYQATVNCLPSMVLFNMHLWYGLTTNPCYFIVFVYRSYHNNVDSMQIYITFNSHRYSILTPFSTCTLFLCYGFTSHMMSTNSYSILIWWIFFWYISIDVCSRDIKTSKSLPSYASMMRQVYRASKDMIVEDASSLGM